MNIEQLRNICLSFPGVTEDIKWEHNLCFCVGGKIFLVLGLDASPPRASFKLTPDEFEALTTREGFRQAPYFAKRQWVYVEDIALLSAQQWQQYAQEAYRLVKAKLPKKVQRELGK